MGKEEKLEGTMGNGTKIALVAALILMVVVIARFVGDREKETTADTTKGGTPKVVSKGPTGKAPAVDPARSKLGAAKENWVPLKANALSGTAPAKPANVPDGTPSPKVAPASGSPGPLPADGKAASPPTASEAQQPPIGQRDTAAQKDTTTRNPTPPQSVAAEAQEIVKPASAGEKPAPASSPPETKASSKTAADAGGKTSVASAGEKVADTTKATYKIEPPPSSPVTPPGETTSGAAPQFPLVYEIKDGDKFWNLAQRFYGNATLYPHIEKANPGVKIRAKNKLTIPPPPAETKLVSKPPEVAPVKKLAVGKAEKDKAAEPGLGKDRTYVVQKGDTPMKLAKRFYGDDSKYNLIIEANEELRYRGLREGEKIKIPAPAN